MTWLSVFVAIAIAGCTSASSEPVVARAAVAKDYEAHVRQLRARLAQHRLGQLAIVVEEPFVVAGDGSALELKRGMETVRWAAGLLERDFFTARPAAILDIFLFTNAASYEAGVRTLTGAAPTTPYGFYSRRHGGLFMNIATGGGTLVHEIVHPYVEADFPDAPPWLDEGLGSLFEQCEERAGHIAGRLNWRLAGLQRAIARDELPSFRELAELDAARFYDDDAGTNYAQARYLLYYLQERGVLRAFYRAARADRGNDPTGYAALVRALGERDMVAFQRRWERFVADLRAP